MLVSNKENNTFQKCGLKYKIEMIKRGPKAKYDFTASEIVLDAVSLSSFKSLVSRYNKDRQDKVYFDFSFKPNSSKVTATKRVQP